MSNINLYNSDANSEILLYHRGNPVFPVISPSEIRIAREAAKTCGIGVKFVTRKECQTEPQSFRDGAVSYFSDEAKPLAILYAHLTNRKTVIRFSIGNKQLPEVLIGYFEDLTLELIQHVKRLSSYQVAGFIAGRDYFELHSNVIAKGIWMSTVPKGQNVAFLRGVNISSRKGSNIFLLGCRSNLAQRVDAFTKGQSRMMTICTHSDGIDADLGSGMVLCGIENERSEGEPPHPAFCKRSGTCHRTALGARGGCFPAASDYPPRFSIKARLGKLFCSEISARFLSLLTCWGYVAHNSINFHGTSLGEQLSISPNIGAIITSYGMIAFRSFDVFRMAERSSEMRNLGDIYKVYTQQSHGGFCGGSFLIVFGDPQFVLNEEQRNIWQDPIRDNVVTRNDHGCASGLFSASHGLPFVELFCERFELSGSETERTGIGKVREALSMKGRISDKEFHFRWHKSFADFLAVFEGTGFETYGQKIQVLKRDSTIECKFCELTCERLTFCLSENRAVLRDFESCAKCGGLSESNTTGELLLKVSDSALEFSGIPEGGSRSILVFFDHLLPHYRKMEFQELPDKSAEFRWEWWPELQEGPAYVGGVLFCDGEWELIGRQIEVHEGKVHLDLGRDGNIYG